MCEANDQHDLRLQGKFIDEAIEDYGYEMQTFCKKLNGRYDAFDLWGLATEYNEIKYNIGYRVAQLTFNHLIPDESTDFVYKCRVSSFIDRTVTIIIDENKLSIANLFKEQNSCTCCNERIKLQHQLEVVEFADYFRIAQRVIDKVIVTP